MNFCNFQSLIICLSHYLFLSLNYILGPRFAESVASLAPCKNLTPKPIYTDTPTSTDKHILKK